MRQLATAGQRHHIKGSEKPVGLESCRPLGNPPSTSNGERSPASLGRRAAGLSLDSKEKPRLRGTGPELTRVRHLKSPASPITPTPNLAFGSGAKPAGADPDNDLSASGCPNLSSRVPSDSAEGGNRPLVGRHDVREAVRPPREIPDGPFP